MVCSLVQNSITALQWSLGEVSLSQEMRGKTSFTFSETSNDQEALCHRKQLSNPLRKHSGVKVHHPREVRKSARKLYYQTT